MDISQVCRFLWITGVVFMIVPHVNMGLLSDYKICGDSECESLLSRVQAIRDHHAKDCRFLSFRRGDTIFVYHKLTGKREDLWAGTIDKQFGYFPKDAVQEEQVYATMEKVVETQRSDFFCMDESGYPIDLDSDDEINNEEIQLQESESTQTVPYADDTNTESLPTATDPSTEAAVSAQRPDGTTAEGDENKNADVESHKEARENPTTLKEQGGSPPSSWLGTSVTGWLGLGKEEESESLTEEDEVKETKAQTLTSSVTGWLGFGGEGKPDDDDVKSKEDNEETASSITSTMTGWLGFGGQTQTQNEQDGEGDMEEENDPKVKFRSRKMSLDLEGSQLQEEEKEEMGTLSWLGSGLTHTLGFGNGNQEPEPETSTETEMIEEVKEESGSWLGIGDMFGFRKDKSEVDESRGSDFEQTEENKTTEEETGSQIVDNSQTLPVQTQTEEDETELHIQNLQEKTEKEMIPEVEDSNSSSSSDGDSNKSKPDQVPQSETGTESVTIALSEDDSNNNSTDASDDSRYNALPVDAESKVDHTDITPKTKLELERPQSVGEIDEDRSAERDGEEHQTLISTGNDSDSEPVEEEIKTAVDSDFVIQHDISLKPEFNPVDLKSDLKSVGQSVSGTEEDEKDQLQTKKTESEDEGEIMSGETGASDAGGGGGGGEGSDEETDALHREISTTQTDEAVDQSQDSGRSSPASSSDRDEEENEPVHSEEEGLTAHIVDTNTESLSEKVLVEDKDTLSPNEDTTQMENSGDQDQDPSVSPQMEQRVKEDENDVDKLKETEKNTENELQQAQVEEETLGLGKELLTDNAANESEKETEAGDAEESKGEENQDEREKQNTEKVEEKHQDKPDQAEDTEEKEAQQEVKEAQDGGNQEEVVEEIKEEEKQEELAKIKEKEKQVEVEELKEAEKQEVVEELEGGKEEEEVQVEKKREEVVEVKEEEKQQEVDEAKEEEKYEEEVALVKKEEGKNEADEVKEEKKQEGVMEDIKEEEKGNAVEGVQEERKQEEVVEKKAEEAEEGTKQEEVIEVKEEMKPEEVEVKDLQEEEKQKEKKDFPEKGNEEKLEDFDKLQKTEMESEEKQTELSHVEPQMENSQNNISRETEIPDENSKTDQTHTVDEKKMMEETQQANVVEDDSRDKQEDKCLNELCPHATDDTYVSDVSEDVGMSHTDPDQNDQISPDRTGEVQTPSEGSERIEQKADGLIVDQTNNTDLSHSAESGGHDLPEGNILSQTTEELSEDKLTHETNDTKPEDTENSSSGTSTEKTPEKMHSSRKTDTEEDTDVRGNKTTDSQMSTDNTVDSESLRDRELESSTIPDGSIESLNGQTAPHVSEQPAGSSPPSDDHNTRTAETENGGAFGLFKSAFSIFGQTPVAETKEPIDSALSLETNTSEPLTPEQELDSGQADESDLSTEQPQPSPSSDEIQMSTSNPHTQSPNTANLLQTKTLSKYYKNLLDHLSVDEMTIMVEFVGQHKLQFLDYMLGSSDTVTEDPDHDESILSDLERLLQHLSETLVAPSMSFTDTTQEDKEKTRTLIALHKLEMLITRVRETFNTAKSDTSKEKHQAEVNCVDASCSTHSNVQETTTEEEKRKDKDRGSEEESVPPASHLQTQPGSTQSLEGVMEQIVDYVHQIAEESTLHMYAVKELLGWITIQVVSSLPDDIRPGPDLYGVPWEPVIFSSVVGLITVLLFTCRCYSSVKSRMYRSKERWMAEQVAQLLDEKCKVLETLSKCQQEYDDLEDSLRDSGVLAQTQKTQQLEDKARQLDDAKKELERDLEQLKDQLDQQREHRTEQERRIALLEENMKTFEEESKELQSQEEQAQTTIKVYSMNSDRLQKNLETAGEENRLTQESNAQLRQQVEGWAERVSELEAEMLRCEAAYSGMQQDVAIKDERILSLTDRLLRMKAWDSDLEEEEGEEGSARETSNGATRKEEENGGNITDPQGHFQKVQKLIFAAKLNADLKSVDEDKDRVFAKLSDEIKAKEDLQLGIKELENEKSALQSDAEHYSDQVQRLQQKLQIMTEMYQENELKLHRLLTVEEKERLQKEEKLNKADKNIALAMEELNNYRKRAEEMEEELEKTKQSYQTQISSHEKKAHNNWLAARAADRELSDIRRENALLRQKLTDTQFKLDALDKDPYALDSLARPLPFRAERSPYGPSPLGRPASETRAFLSPPTLMDGPPARLSPRVGRGPMEPPGGQGEMERSGGPHSDSGSNSPSWERDRRGPPPGPPGPHGPPGPLGPPGYMFPEPGAPMYRRPPPPPGALPPGALPPGVLPPGVLPPGVLPPGPPLPHPRGFPPAGPPHPADISDGSFRENSLGPGDQEHSESGPGDRRTPPEGDPRMRGPPLGPPVGHMDGPFPRRAPYGPPPPDFYPPRGPGGPPMRPMWAPPPPEMMFPPRFPPGGPPPPGQHLRYAPPMRPPPPDGLPPPSMGPLPPQQSVPSPPHSQSPEEHRPSPEDAI